MRERGKRATQTVFKWTEVEENLHNKSNRERVFQLSALIKMFSYINRLNEHLFGRKYLGELESKHEQPTWYKNVKAPAKEFV